MMSEPQITVAQFREAAQDRFKFLQGFGFRRSPESEVMSPTGATVVFLGKHVGLVFAFDVRDQRVDTQVAMVQNGKLRRNWEGGFSSDLFTFLVRHAGYRGSHDRSVGSTHRAAGDGDLNQMLDMWVDLLRKNGQKLLEDSPESLT